MGLFDKLFGKGAKKSGYSYIAEIAELTAPGSGISEVLSGAFAEPYEYFIKVEYRFDARGLVIGMVDNETMFWISLVDELAAKDYVFEAERGCKLEKFNTALKRMKSYDMIKDTVSAVDLNENGDVGKWCGDINRALEGKAFLCCFDIDSDSVPLVIVSGDILPQIQKLAADHDHRIDKL
ncbi:MAG: hypothetical protein K2N56_00940 [Oscillospiraceae bacterium]|nr:hypothetical protein [Oscillospiraceae bacterium]